MTEQFKATNLDISRAFSKIAEILEIQGENVFRIRAYERAAQMIDGLPEECGDIYNGGGLAALRAIPGIGDDLSNKIEEMLKTGKLKALEELRKKVPEGVVDILSIEGMGPKKTKFVWKKFKVDSVDKLEALVKSGKLSNLRGWGEKSSANIFHAIELSRKMGGRLPIHEVMNIAEKIVDLLKKSKLCENVEIAGSLRRMKDSIGDIDILVTSKKPKAVTDLFTKMTYVSEVISTGPTKSTVLLKSGIEADIRVLDPKQFGAGLYYFTGSKEHHVLTRTIAVKKGITISEYGVYKGTKENKGILLAAKTENDVFRAIGLPYIPPELREARGEIEAAIKDQLPKLVEEEDIKGDLHMHSNISDGDDTILEMVGAVKQKDYEYIAITDHSSSMGMVKGVKKDNIDHYLSLVNEARKKFSTIHILAGSEVDISKDGSLYLPDECLRRLDWVVASVHLNIKMTADEMTKRYLKAIENPFVNVIAHPTSRIVGSRAPFEFDFIKVAEHAKKHNVALEINSSYRLDLNDVHIRQAKEIGVKMVINSDAHTKSGFGLRFGVGQARRGWCEKNDILNCLDWKDFISHIKK
ncbi:MAG: DNA polymerase/3'-5' exonuclease PolX [Candidatus Vogelbacteria bacterium]|nr:DNA polymerase/3'-5' exonuclease PolX [Candidatus Vogelbacteria bacterium]